MQEGPEVAPVELLRARPAKPQKIVEQRPQMSVRWPWEVREVLEVLEAKEALKAQRALGASEPEPNTLEELERTGRVTR
jgi:hypothetical protein